MSMSIQCIIFYDNNIIKNYINDLIISIVVQFVYFCAITIGLPDVQYHASQSKISVFKTYISVQSYYRHNNTWDLIGLNNFDEEINTY